MKVDFGIIGDAHSGDWHRQVSLLELESINEMIAKGVKVAPGDFAENITTRGIDLVSLPLKTRLGIGSEAVIEMTRIGKDCHRRCSIFYRVGDCIMPGEGVFARVIKGGLIRKGDGIEVLK